MLRTAFTRLYTWFTSLHTSLFDYTPVRLAIVRRYTDANGSYVGELYRCDNAAPNGDGMYYIIGCSLDTLPLELRDISLALEPVIWDLEHDFLAPMAANTLRVGAAQPCDNDAVRGAIARIPRRNIRVSIQNRFIEHVLEGKTK